MRTLGVAVVTLGIAALAFIAMDAVQTAIDGASGHAAAGNNGREFPRLFFWATFVGVIALVTLATGIGDMVMSRRDQNPMTPPRARNGETAAMIDAEVNEGGPPSPLPCDTPFEGKACRKEPTFMSEEPPPIETCPAPDRILHLPIGAVVGAAKSSTLMKSCPQEIHALKGIVDSSVLVTRLRPHADELPEKVPAR